MSLCPGGEEGGWVTGCHAQGHWPAWATLPWGAMVLDGAGSLEQLQGQRGQAGY